MWKRQYIKTVKGISTEDVWKRWIDIDHWAEWHGDLDYCCLNGNFAVGSTFTLKPKGMKPVEIELTEINEGESFRDCTRFPGARMFNIHTVRAVSGGVEVSNELTISGPLSFFWFFLVGRNVAASIPEETEALIACIKGAKA